MTLVSKLRTGRFEDDDMDGEDGVKRRGTSATDVQFMHSKNCETSEGKFLGYMVRTSPG